MKYRKQVRKRKPKLLPPPRTIDEFNAMSQDDQESWIHTTNVISMMRSGGRSLKQAATDNGAELKSITRWRVRALKKRLNRSYSVSNTDNLLRVLHIATPKGVKEVATKSSRHASTLARHWDAVNKYVRAGDDSRLNKFTGKQIKDANGNKISLITDHSELDRLGSAGVLSFENLYARSA
jgi:hypothetical protein